MESEELIICRECGDPTNEPPFPEWRGLCPECVVKVFVLPLIEDQNLRDLISMKMSAKIEIALIDPSDIQGKDLLGHLKVLFKDKFIRDKIRQIIDLYDKNEVKEEKVRVNQPVVRNDPRTG